MDGASLTGPPLVGPVRGVGRNGVFVGHWPEPDDRYTFSGYIRNFQLYKRDDQEDLKKLLDPCCIKDVSEWMEIGHELRKQGYSLKGANEQLGKLLEMGSSLIADWRGDSAEKTEQLDELLRQAVFAVRKRNSVPVRTSLRALMDWVRDNTDPGALDSVTENVGSIFKELKTTPEDLVKLGEKLCFSKFMEDVKAEAEDVRKDPEWQKFIERFKQRRKR